MVSSQMSLEPLEKLIRDDLVQYAKLNRASVARFQENKHADNVLLDALEAAPDISPALLVVLGYRIAGGDNDSSIMPIARAIMMTHLYAQDMSATPDLSVISGMHAAEIIISKSGLTATQRLTILSQLNKTLLLYAQAKAHREQHSEKVQTCYAAQLFAMPLQVGLIAGQAPKSHIDAILPFAVAAGRAQLSSDSVATSYRQRAAELLAQNDHLIHNTFYDQLMLMVNSTRRS